MSDRIQTLADRAGGDIRDLARMVIDERDLHSVSLEFLSKLEGWGWGENAPDLAKQEWEEARAWLAKVRPDA